MTKNKSATGRRSKKSNTTTQNDGAKRSKIEEKNSAEYRNGILQGIRALLGKMDVTRNLLLSWLIFLQWRRNKNQQHYNH